MINLLIVDDEVFTREGLIDILPLKKLGITKTIQAFDGIDALSKVKDFEPNILITDVRMPRMDGIELAFEIRKIYPKCSIIFMSGYSDKEYLKSAISLKAISYVEKPIEIDVLENAIKAAIFENSKLKVMHENFEKYIILEIINGNNNIEDIIKHTISSDLYLKLKDSAFVTILLKTQTEIDCSTVNDIKTSCSSYNFNTFISLKDNFEIVIQLFFSKNQLNKNLKSDAFNSLFLSMSELLKKYINYYICIGKVFYELNDISNSYKSANEILNITFFYNYNSILFSPKINKGSIIISEDIYLEFDKFLLAEDHIKLVSILKSLTFNFVNHTDTSISYIKDVYYKLFLKISVFINKKNLSIIENPKSKNVFQEILKCSNIFALENILKDKIDELFVILSNRTSENNPVLSILNYIHNNYSDPNLCLDQISVKTFLTPSYICVIFKDYTLTTVNKYISKYRIEKAKLLLMNPNLNISEIAEKVGYNDGNYFCKIFRKETSYTPSEYRRTFCS